VTDRLVDLLASALEGPSLLTQSVGHPASFFFFFLSVGVLLPLTLPV